ncbi:cardiolipin synthase B [Rhodoferax koreense]|uniref:Cardiolipin synthase B n=1 Tax=Rhodoferax koreensis TaxID=1842727 RepID=A0A1P8JTY9_9BURK|nr:cardiolipin synthase ClsB [Rhodoferax koreense]APW37195.1 cardiolipin synthase B [Rhodoferax koreense]
MSRSAPRLRGGHHLRLLEGSRELFPALIEAMDGARHEVRLETYIFDFTGAGASVAEALARAAERGVKVCLTVDGLGTGVLPALWRSRFGQAGVAWRVYSPVSAMALLLPTRWRRLHRKLCVIDGELAFCGGINILDDFHDPTHGVLAAPRFDFAVRITGPLVAEAEQTVALLWRRLQAVRELRQHHLHKAVQRLLAPITLPAPAGQSLAGGHLARAALVLRDNLRSRKRIERAYLRAIGAARREIIIANAYFVPGFKLRRALVLAAERGVRVQLLLQGRYEYFMQYHASRPIYGALLGAGVEIFEYAPSFLHAKVAVIDGHWATVGSSNLDPLSLLLAREANVVVDDAGFATELRDRLLGAMQLAGPAVDPATYARRPLRQRGMEYLAMLVMRLALLVTRNRY